MVLGGGGSSRTWGTNLTWAPQCPGVICQLDGMGRAAGALHTADWGGGKVCAG